MQGSQELILVLGSQPASDCSHKLSSRLPLLSAKPTVTSPVQTGLEKIVKIRFFALNQML